MNKLLKLLMVVSLVLVMTSCSKEESPLVKEVESLEEEMAQLELVGEALSMEWVERTNELNGVMEVLLAEQQRLSEKENLVEDARETFNMTRQQLNIMVAKKNARSQLTDDWSRYHISYVSEKQKAAPLSEDMALTLTKLARNYHSIYDDAYGFWRDNEENSELPLIEGDERNKDVHWFLAQSEFYATETSFRSYLGKIFTPVAADQLIDDVLTYDIYEKKSFLSYGGRLYTTLSDGSGFPPMYYERLDQARCLFETYTGTRATVTLMYPTYGVDDLPVELEVPVDIEFRKETYELEKTEKGWRISSIQAPRFN